MYASIGQGAWVLIGRRCANIAPSASCCFMCFLGLAPARRDMVGSNARPMFRGPAGDEMYTRSMILLMLFPK